MNPRIPRMSRMPRIMAVVAVVLGVAAAAWAQLLGVGGDTSKLTIIAMPATGKTMVGAADVGGLLRDGPSENITTIVKCFGTIRYNFIAARVSLLGVTEDAGFGTDLFPETPGTHTATLSAYVPGNAQPLAEAQTTFTITKPESVEGPAVDECRNQLAVLAATVESAEKRYAQVSQEATGSDRIKRIAEAADAVQRARVADFFGRIQGCATMAALYQKALDPEEGLRLLNLAQEIFDGERDTAGIHPQTGVNLLEIPGRVAQAPAHFSGLARHYTRLGDLEKAVRWYQKDVDWFNQQGRRADLDDRGRKDCRRAAAISCRHIAEVHVQLKNNLDEYKSWRDQADKLEQ